MTTFPTLQPGSRAITPGTYPGATFRTLSGRDSRVRHSNAVVEMRAKAEFPLLSESQLESIRSHYVGQQGGHQSFAVPDEFWSGADTPAGFTPSGYQWRYASTPSIDEITIDTSGTAVTLFNVSIELEAVPLAAVVLSGATFNITTTWLPGYKAIAANGATWDVTVSWVPGGSSTWGPGVDPYFANVSLLLNGDSFTDLSSNSLTVTPQGNAAIVAGQGPFGGAAMAFDGSTSYTTTPHNSVISIQSGDFTLEAWLYRSASGASHYILSKRPADATQNGWEWRINANNTLQFFFTGGSSVTSSSTVPSGSWSFVQVVRASNTVTLYINGASGGSATFANGTENTADTLKIGAGNDLSNKFNGLIGPLRITNGVARAITVPTAAFPTA